ncbi:hypothetical protein RJT34_15949 [Clitoria ternatea]|uniref:Uncharacterized protein n=1 Tax=Clitoria ternatea TaxID=43366 RepID=A0AAN9PBW9_CLITE
MEFVRKALNHSSRSQLHLPLTNGKTDYPNFTYKQTKQPPLTRSKSGRCTPLVTLLIATCLSPSLCSLVFSFASILTLLPSLSLPLSFTVSLSAASYGFRYSEEEVAPIRSQKAIPILLLFSPSEAI